MSEEYFDICFHVGVSSNNAESYVRHKQYFESFGLKVMLVTFNPQHEQLWLSAGIEKTEFRILTPAKGPVDHQKMEDLYYGLGFRNFTDMYRSEIFFWDYREKPCYDLAARYLACVFSMTDFPRVKYFYTYEGDELDHNIFRALCRFAGGEMIYFGFSNLKNRIFFHQNEDRYWNPDFSYTDEVSADDIAWVKNYIREHTEGKRFLWGDPNAWDILKWNWNYPFVLARRVFRMFFPEKDGLVRPDHTLGGSVKRLTKRFTRRQLLKLHYENDLKPYESRFFYFPLHMVNDSQITQRALPYVNQASLIETISHYLPHPYVLVIKDHPCGRGLMKNSDIKRITSLSNVVYISPSFNSHDLIVKAEGIMTINSSVGYEALMYKKTVITFGRSFYRGRGFTLDIDSLYDLEQVFAQAKHHTFDHDAFIRFLATLKQKTYELDLIRQMDSSNPELDKSFVLTVYDWLTKNKKIATRNELVHE